MGASRSKQVFVGLRIGRKAALQFAEVAAEGGQQRVPDFAVAGVVAAGDLAVHAGERLPQVVAGVRQPQVKVVVGGQRLEQFDLGARQPGVTEERDALGQVGGRLLQCDKRFRVPDMGRVGVDAVQQRPPQVWLPVEVGVEPVGGVVLPVDEQLRPLPRVGREEPGQPARDGVAAAHPQLAFLARLEVAEVGGQGLAPVGLAAVVDHVEQRPHERVGMPRVFVVGAGDLGDQRARVAERDACADAVLSRPAAEDVRQPLAQPPLDALGRDDDELLGERVGQGIGEKRAEAVGQEIGSLRAVDDAMPSGVRLRLPCRRLRRVASARRRPARVPRPSSCPARARDTPRAGCRSTRGGRAGSSG